MEVRSPQRFRFNLEKVNFIFIVEFLPKMFTNFIFSNFYSDLEKIVESKLHAWRNKLWMQYNF